MDKIRVLLAEDHVLVRESIKQYIEREPDIEVIGEAGDGEQMVSLAGEFKPDVIVADVAMPKMNGIEATRQVKALGLPVQILILTAYDYDQYVFAILEAGASGYLLKDISGQELIDSIRATYNGDSVLHPAIARKLMQMFRGNRRNQGLKPFESITEREIEVLKLAAQGRNNKEIADDLGLSVRTVEAHFGHIFNKLGINSRTEAVIIALKKGWIDLD